MKHLVLLLVLCIGVYAFWQLINKREKGEVLKFIGRHLFPIVSIVFVLIMGLVAMFYSHSISLL